MIWIEADQFLKVAKIDQCTKYSTTNFKMLIELRCLNEDVGELQVIPLVLQRKLENGIPEMSTPYSSIMGTG
jgi:hypothetical protein